MDEVIVPPETNGTWTVIDWDNIESDPAREWDQFDEVLSMLFSFRGGDTTSCAFFSIEMYMP